MADHVPTNVRWIAPDDLAAELLTNNPQGEAGSLEMDSDLVDLARGGYIQAGRDLDTGNIVLRWTGKGRAFILEGD